ncbi:S49 family peptidase [Burkholderia glumae]|uniref:S49 family peptidase n=1 Tax=Burkholderia glumae TaxID=337 RepID=UPI000474EEE2|nr:S49 family peptidase [Burkholderia glumae]PJO23694.1 peptidase S49 [Burkholderia glumae AU6208]QHE09816.1 S49 family peptidase [Burkholderia glumae AU6208]
MSHLLTQFVNTPWAIQTERLQMMATVLARWSAGGHATEAVLASVRADHAAVAARRANTGRNVGGNIAVLCFYGSVLQRKSPADDVSGSGFMSLEQFMSQFRAMMADSSVSGILIDIDSPGGGVYGVPEAAAEIRAARGKKPVYAVANSVAASAAYWITSSASEFYVTSSGEVGSIGVYASHQDLSVALEKEGIKTTLVSAGKYKTERNPFGPLSKEAEAAMQSRIDAYYRTFVQDVARSRNVDAAHVNARMGQGRLVGASDAVAAKMADGVRTFDEVLAKLSRDISAKRMPGSPRSMASGGTMRASQARAGSDSGNTDRLSNVSNAGRLRSRRPSQLRRELDLLDAMAGVKKE